MSWTFICLFLFLQTIQFFSMHFVQLDYGYFPRNFPVMEEQAISDFKWVVKMICVIFHSLSRLQTSKV